jgi:iron complex transport system substrate-binding protein
MSKRVVWLGCLVAAAVVIVASFAGVRWFQASGAPASRSVTQAAAAQQLVITHAQGETTVSLHPQRVAVFDLGALDTLDALGVEVLGVAGREFPAHLHHYASGKYAYLGTLFEPDYEAVNAARPELIIIGGRSSAKYAQLSRIAPTIDMSVDYVHPVQTVLANARLLGTIFGREAKAEELITQITQEVAALRAKTSHRGRGLIVLVSGGKLSAYGPGSRFGMLHTDFGVTPAAPNLMVSTHGEAISPEFILKTNPDWLFVIDRDAAIGQTGAARQVLDNPLVRQTTAWKQGQVLYLDPANWYLIGGGIQALHSMIKQVSESYGRVR